MSMVPEYRFPVHAGYENPTTSAAATMAPAARTGHRVPRARLIAAPAPSPINRVSPSVSIAPALLVVRNPESQGMAWKPLSSTCPIGVRASGGKSPTMSGAPIATRMAARTRARERDTAAPAAAATGIAKLAATTSPSVMYLTSLGRNGRVPKRPYRGQTPSSLAVSEYDDVEAMS